MLSGWFPSLLALSLKYSHQEPAICPNPGWLEWGRVSLPFPYLDPSCEQVRVIDWSLWTTALSSPSAPLCLELPGAALPGFVCSQYSCVSVTRVALFTVISRAEGWVTGDSWLRSFGRGKEKRGIPGSKPLCLGECVRGGSPVLSLQRWGKELFQSSGWSELAFAAPWNPTFPKIA